MKSTTAWAVVCSGQLIKRAEWYCVFTSKKEAVAFREQMLGDIQRYIIVRVRIIPAKGEK